METSQLPVSNLLMGKGIVEAYKKKYLGLSFRYENINVYNALHESDCVYLLGVINSDLNTYRSGLPFLPADFIEIQGNYTIIEHKKYENVLMKDMLNALSDKIDTKGHSNANQKTEL